MAFRQRRLAAPGGNFAEPGQQPEPVAGVGGRRQGQLQGPVGDIELAAIGLHQTAAAAEQRRAAEALQGRALLLRRRISGLHQEDRGAPGMGRGEPGIEREGRGKIIEGAAKVMAILPQQAANDAQGSRRRLAKASDHCLGITHIARVSTCHGEIEIGLRECGRGLRSARRSQHAGAQCRQFARTAVTGAQGQAFEQFAVRQRFARRSKGGHGQRRHGKQQRDQSETAETGQLAECHGRYKLFVRAIPAVANLNNISKEST